MDASHYPVGDLRAADSNVTVDGRPRKVVSAHFVRYDVKMILPGGQPSLATRAEEIEPAIGATSARNVILALDVDGIDAGDGIQARQAARAPITGPAL